MYLPETDENMLSIFVGLLRKWLRTIDMINWSNLFLFYWDTILFL